MNALPAIRKNPRKALVHRLRSILAPINHANREPPRRLRNLSGCFWAPATHPRREVSQHRSGPALCSSQNTRSGRGGVLHQLSCENGFGSRKQRPSDSGNHISMMLRSRKENVPRRLFTLRKTVGGTKKREGLLKASIQLPALSKPKLTLQAETVKVDIIVDRASVLARQQTTFETVMEERKERQPQRTLTLQQLPNPPLEESMHSDESTVAAGEGETGIVGEVEGLSTDEDVV